MAALIVLAVNPPVKLVAPVTVPPVNDDDVVGRFKYVVADIVLAVKPAVKLVAPVTVPPVNDVDGRFEYVVADTEAIERLPCIFSAFMFLVAIYYKY